MSMQNNVGMSIDDIRYAARTVTYPNSEAERANLRRVDDEVFARVRLLERGIISDAQELLDNGGVELQAATKFTEAIRQDVVFALDRVDADTQTIAERYEQLRSQAEQAIAALERADRQSEWHIGRLDDPYGAYVSMVSKYPTLRPTIRIQ